MQPQIRAPPTPWGRLGAVPSQDAWAPCSSRLRGGSMHPPCTTVPGWQPESQKVGGGGGDTVGSFLRGNKDEELIP